ncbi:MAG: SDR family oxidoreductase [Proteobacteria bacterium]|nr:SDR family oxidoreductase [Pseudomonadota bacterium]
MPETGTRYSPSACWRVLIAGCGYVGTELGCRLAAAGHQVWGLRRQPAALPAGIQPLQADLARPSTLGALPPALDAVVYAAAADRGDDAAYAATYRDGLAHLLDALRAQRQRPRRVIFVSSTSVYGQHEGEWVDEESPAEPARAASRHLLAGETLLANASFPGTTVRLTGIYGPGRTRLVDQVRSGAARLHGGPPSFTNRIHRDDCAGLLAHLLTLADPQPLYLGTDSDPAPQNEVLAWIAKQLGVASPPTSEATPSETAHSSGQNKRCSNRRLLASGYALRYPTFREGYGALLGERALPGDPPSR